MKPICVPCQRFYRPSKNGVFFVEGMPDGNDVRPGLDEPGKWSPYKLWSGDEWECRGCGSTIIVGCGREPISEHYKPDFAEDVASFCGSKPLQINDC